MITLGVKDLAASRRFYVDGLGWKPVYQDNEILFFQTGGIVFALFLHDKLAADFRADPASLGRAPMSLGYNVGAKPEVDQLMERAAAAGAKILKPAPETSWAAIQAISRIPTILRGKSPGTPPGQSVRTAVSAFISAFSRARLEGRVSSACCPK